MFRGTKSETEDVKDHHDSDSPDSNFDSYNRLRITIKNSWNYWGNTKQNEICHKFPCNHY